MVLAALAPDDEALKASQYRVLELWQSTYEGALVDHAAGHVRHNAVPARTRPDWAADWTGQRIDSKDPYIAGDEYIEWLKTRGRESREQAAYRIRRPGRGSDTRSACLLWRHSGRRHSAGRFPKCRRFYGPAKMDSGRRIRFSAGWGTLLTNDFRGCDPAGGTVDLIRISLICKVSDVDGRPAVKLSDNYSKALGPPSEIERYRRVFGTDGVSDIPVIA